MRTICETDAVVKREGLIAFFRTRRITLLGCMKRCIRIQNQRGWINERNKADSNSDRTMATVSGGRITKLKVRNN